MKSNLNSSELQKRYFLYLHKQICSKVPIVLYFVRPKCPSGNCYVSCFLTEKTPLTPGSFLHCKLIHFPEVGHPFKLMISRGGPPFFIGSWSLQEVGHHFKLIISRGGPPFYIASCQFPEVGTRFTLEADHFKRWTITCITC